MTLHGQCASRGITLSLTIEEAQAAMVALELRRLNNQWSSAHLRDAAAHAEAKIARLLRESGDA
jgi:predicted DNA-binding transcriptional regulator YafY